MISFLKKLWRKLFPEQNSYYGNYRYKSSYTYKSNFSKDYHDMTEDEREQFKKVFEKFDETMVEMDELFDMTKKDRRK